MAEALMYIGTAFTLCGAVLGLVAIFIGILEWRLERAKRNIK